MDRGRLARAPGVLATLARLGYIAVGVVSPGGCSSAPARALLWRVRAQADRLLHLHRRRAGAADRACSSCSAWLLLVHERQRLPVQATVSTAVVDNAQALASRRPATESSSATAATRGRRRMLDRCVAPRGSRAIRGLSLVLVPRAGPTRRRRRSARRQRRRARRSSAPGLGTRRRRRLPSWIGRAVRRATRTRTAWSTAAAGRQQPVELVVRAVARRRSQRLERRRRRAARRADVAAIEETPASELVELTTRATTASPAPRRRRRRRPRSPATDPPTRRVAADWVAEPSVFVRSRTGRPGEHRRRRASRSASRPASIYDRISSGAAVAVGRAEHRPGAAAGPRSSSACCS